MSAQLDLGGRGCDRPLSPRNGKGLGNLEVVSLEGEPSVLLHAALDKSGKEG